VTRRERTSLFAVLAVAFLLRLLLVLTLEGSPFFRVLIVDSAAFDRWAREIATEDFFGRHAFFQDPLYAYGLGLFYKVYGAHHAGARLAARIAQGVIGTAGLWMLFEAARRTLGYRAGMAALVQGALFKPFLFFDGMILKDFLGVVAVEGALLAWSCTFEGKSPASTSELPEAPGSPNRRRLAWGALGAALGLGSLVRGNMMLLVLAAAGYLGLRREWRRAGLVLGGAMLVVLPVTVRNAVVEKDLVLSTSHFGVNLFIGNNPENTTGRYRPPSFLRVASPEFEESDFRLEAERLSGRPLKPSQVDAFWRGRALEYIGGHLGTFLGVTLKRALMLASSFEIPDDHNLYFMERFSWVLRMPLFTFGLFVAPLAMAGLYLGWVERAKFGMLYVLLGAYALSIVFFFIFGRYRLPLVPILLFFAGHAVAKTAQLIQWRMSEVPRRAAIVFGVSLVLVNLPLPAAIGGHRDFRAAHYNLGIYYKENDQPALAAREFEDAARLNPAYLELAPFVWALAESLERSGQVEPAFEAYERAARLDTTSPEPPYRVGMIYFHRGMNERAAVKLADSVRRDPAFGPAYLPLAEANLRLRKFPEALEALERGTRAAPQDWRIPLKRAQVYEGLSMWSEAFTAAQETLRLRTDQADAVRIRDLARKKLK
jgi:tetratricopeptide (TPR) repeat protein